MSGKVSEVLQARCEELEASSGAAARAMMGGQGFGWAKLGAAYPVEAVPPALFDRKELGADYAEAVDSGKAGSQKKAQTAKVQAEMLEAMQRGTVMRYGRSRIWAMAAAFSRCKAMEDGKQIRRLPDFIAASDS